jgi:hypothetical protein
MSVVSGPDVVAPVSWTTVLRALIEQARRRARRRRALVLFVVAIVAAVLVFLARDDALLGSARAADTKVIPVKWIETQKFANDRGVVRLHVRKLEFTGTTWKASVGLTNLSKRRIEVNRRQRIYQDTGRPVVGGGFPGASPVTYVAAPGIWWDRYEAGTTFTHVARVTSIRPRYAATLAPRKTWFGVFTGTTACLPKDRLLRIGFGVACFCPDEVDHMGLLSTNHQFKLPRR